MKRVKVKGITNKSKGVECVLMSKSDITHVLKRAWGYFFVYVLSDNDNIIYIGASSNIYNRLMQHKGQKIFDTVLLIELPTKEDLRAMEKKLIMKYEPKYNVQYLQ